MKIRVCVSEIYVSDMRDTTVYGQFFRKVFYHFSKQIDDTQGNNGFAASLMYYLLFEFQINSLNRVLSIEEQVLHVS